MRSGRDDWRETEEWVGAWLEMEENHHHHVVSEQRWEDIKRRTHRDLEKQGFLPSEDDEDTQKS